MQKNKTEINIDDISFILDEIVRLNGMDWETLKEYYKKDKRDWLFTIPHFSGDGELTLGEAAGRRLQSFAVRYLSTDADLDSNFDTNHFIQALKKDFVWIFLKNNSEVNQRNINKMLLAAIKRAKANHKILTHYIPCVLFRSKGHEAFRIGPVQFIWMEKFLEINKERFETERQNIRAEHIIIHSANR